MLPDDDSTLVATSQKNPGLRIVAFISHAHVDAEIAGHLVSLLKSITTLQGAQILCTSAPNHSIPNDETITERLQRDVDGAMAFIALLSEEALDSTWVKFELGAAWGRNKKSLLILGPGITEDDERLGPLRAVPLLSIDRPDAAEWIQSRLERQAISCGFHKSIDGTGLALIREWVESFRQLGGSFEDFSKTTVEIEKPVHVVGVSPSRIRAKISVGGEFRVGWDGFIWVCAYSAEHGEYWPKKVIPSAPGMYEFSFLEGGKVGKGQIELAVVGCGRSGNRRVTRWIDQCNRGEGCPPFLLPSFVRGIVLNVAAVYDYSAS